MKRICVMFSAIMAFGVVMLGRTAFAETLSLPQDVTDVEEEAFFGD